MSSPRLLRQKRCASREQAACSCVVPICWASALPFAPSSTAKPKAIVNVRMETSSGLGKDIQLGAMTLVPEKDEIAARCRARSFTTLRLCRFPVRGKPLIDEGDLCVDRRMPQALLESDELHQLVGTFDIGRAILQCPRGGGRTRQALRGGCIFFERNKIGRIGAELHAQIEHKVVDRTRFLDVGV